jgi:hypothetical protein
MRNLEAKVFSFFLYLFLDLKSCLQAALYPLPGRMQPPGHVFEAQERVKCGPQTTFQIKKKKKKEAENFCFQGRCIKLCPLY